MRVSASSLVPALLLCAAGVGIGQSAAACDGPPNGTWGLTTTIFGPQEAMIGLGRAVGHGFEVSGNLTGKAWQVFEENEIKVVHESYDLKLRALMIEVGAGVHKDLVDWDRLRVRGGASIGIGWTRSKAEFLHDETGDRLSGEGVGFGWEIGPSFELETPIHGPLGLVLFLEPLRFTGNWSRQDGIIAEWFAEYVPTKTHRRGLRTEIDPSLLVRLRF